MSMTSPDRIEMNLSQRQRLRRLVRAGTTAQQLVARARIRCRDGGPSTNTSSTTRIPEDDRRGSSKPWSTDDLRQIIDTAPTYKTMARWARAMDVAAEHPEEFLSTAQIASEAGMTINEWRDAPRKLPQHLTAHFAANIQWPLAGVGGRELGQDDQVYWGLTAEQAQRWLRARAQASDNGSRMTPDGN